MNKQALPEVIDSRYIEEDMSVISHYNRAVSQKEQKITTDAIFEFGLMRKIKDAILLVCNANSGLADSDSAVLKDPEMINLANSIRSGKQNINITISKRVREMHYPMFMWADRYYSAKQVNFVSFLMEKLGFSDKDSFYTWFSHHYAMRDIFYYHSHRMNIVQWEKSCMAVTGKKWYGIRK